MVVRPQHPHAAVRGRHHDSMCGGVTCLRLFAANTSGSPARKNAQNDDQARSAEGRACSDPRVRTTCHQLLQSDDGRFPVSRCLPPARAASAKSVGQYSHQKVDDQAAIAWSTGATSIKKNSSARFLAMSGTRFVTEPTNELPSNIDLPGLCRARNWNVANIRRTRIAP